jgi:hypothetical protein
MITITFLKANVLPKKLIDMTVGDIYKNDHENTKTFETRNEKFVFRVFILS